MPTSWDSTLRDHAANYLLNVEAAPGVTAMLTRFNLSYAFALRGTGYAYAPRDGAGELTMIDGIHPDLCTVLRTGRARFYDFEDGDWIQRPVPGRMRYMAEDGWTGRSPISVAAESFGIALAGQEAAARAGYWLASQAREITGAPGAALGSIGAGVMTGAYVQPGQGSGIQLYEFTSPHARAKWPDPSTEEGRTEILRSLGEAEARFHVAAAAGRGMTPEDLRSRASVTEDVRDGGAMFDGADAVKRGLADREESRMAFYTRVLGTYAPALRKTAGSSALARAAY